MKLREFQLSYLENLARIAPGTRRSSYGGNGGPVKAWKCAVSLAKLGVVDGPTELIEMAMDADPPHTLNDKGRRWLYENVAPVFGSRDVLTGRVLSFDERMADTERRQEIRRLIYDGARSYKGYTRWLIDAVEAVEAQKTTSDNLRLRLGEF